MTPPAKRGTVQRVYVVHLYIYPFVRENIKPSARIRTSRGLKRRDPVTLLHQLLVKLRVPRFEANFTRANELMLSRFQNKRSQLIIVFKKPKVIINHLEIKSLKFKVIFSAP